MKFLPMFFINRPGVAGAVLQLTLLLNIYLTHSLMVCAIIFIGFSLALRSH